MIQVIGYLIGLNINSLWPAIGPIFAGLGGALAGAAAVWSQRNKSKSDAADYHNSLLEAMRQHLAYVSGENVSLRKRVDTLSEQVHTCQQDKFEMQRLLAEWERKWEARFRGEPDATNAA